MTLLSSWENMLDLHTHTLLSDGALLPEELARRVEVLDYRYLALTDHAGPSNLAFVVQGALRAAEALKGLLAVTLIPGVELTHTPPRLIGPLTEQARALGARWVVVHGETVVEPVAPGTNQAALEAGVDCLAHPGPLTLAQAELAARRGVYLEISAKAGHCLYNGWVVQLARRTGARLLVNSDAHAPADLMTSAKARHVALGAGLSEAEADQLRAQALDLAARLAV